MDSVSSTITASEHGLYMYVPSTDTVTQEIVLTTQECIWGIDEDSNGTIFAGVYSFPTDNGDVYRSTDNGDNWSIIFSPVYDSSGLVNNHTHSVFVDKSNDYVYVCGGDDYGGSLNFRSTDGGDSFSEILAGETINQFTAGIAVDGARLFGTDQLSYGRIYRTTDDSTLTLVLDTHYQNCFFLRQSDVTGWIYAGFKLDPSASTDFRADIYVSKDLGLTWILYDTIYDLSISEGFWFCSQFHNGKMIISVDFDGGFQNSIMLHEDTVLSNSGNVRKVAINRALNEFDNNKILDVYNSSILTIPSIGLPDSFKCEISSTEGETIVIDDGGDVVLDFQKGTGLIEGSFGKIFRKRNKNEYKGVLEWSTASELPLMHNLVASYSLAGDSTDEHTNGLDGADTNMTYGADYADFNGSNGYIEFPDDDVFSATNGASDVPYSFEAWVYFDTADEGYIINKQINNTSLEYILAYAGGNLTMIFDEIDNGTAYIRANYPWSPSTGTWYHVVCTYDGSGIETGIKIYLDGVLLTTTNIINNSYSNMSNGSSSVGIGRNHRTNSVYLDGRMKNIRFWKNRELSLANVNQLYNSGSGLTYAEL